MPSNAQRFLFCLSGFLLSSHLGPTPFGDSRPATKWRAWYAESPAERYFGDNLDRIAATAAWYLSRAEARRDSQQISDFHHLCERLGDEWEERTVVGGNAWRNLVAIAQIAQAGALAAAVAIP